jgi:hypothetical protein
VSNFRRRLLATLFLLLALRSATSAQPLHQVVGGCGGAPPERNLVANPDTYRALLLGAGPGDRLLLVAGTYTQGLPFANQSGAANRCIVVEGPSEGPPARFTGSNSWNTISIRNSSYLAVRNLDLDGLGLAGDGVKAEGDAQWSHHITIENLRLTGYGAEQSRVGISTKSPAWNWVIRRNIIAGAGTGLYLGNSDGSAEFVAGLIEHNLITDSIGYNAQIKHQNGRATGLGAPATATTIVRFNVFSKVAGFSTGDAARPNLLVGHWPLAGAGSADTYQIYGNFFYQNPSEALFQGEGNVALYANLFLNRDGAAIHIQPHNDQPRAIEVFWNTVVASTRGLRITGASPGTTQRVRGNAVFSALAIEGGTQSGNVYDQFSAAANYLANPGGAIGVDLDLAPLVGTLAGPPLDTLGLSTFLEWNRDFDAVLRDGGRRGAYATSGRSWPLALAIRPETAAPAASFYTLPPCRILDTRAPTAIVGGPALQAGVARAFPIAGRCGVPLGAVAIAANATALDATADGTVLLFPAGQPSPAASTVAVRVAQTRASATVTGLSDRGEVAASVVLAGTTHLLLDVSGYFR